MTSSLPGLNLSLESAGTELHIDIHGRLFAVPVPDGIVLRRAVIDIAYDACLSMRDLGTVYRAVEGLDLQLDSPADTGRSDIVFQSPVYAAATKLSLV